MNEELTKSPNNTKVIDFVCENCDNEFQLKAQNKPFSKRVVDGAFKPMINSIKSKLNPNFSIMHYSIKNLIVENLIIIPKSFFSASIIEKRKPLSVNARRSGWVGCNILLSNLPIIGQVKVIEDQKIISKNNANKQWKESIFLEKTSIEKRAWISDVLNCIEKLNKKEFYLDELYGFEGYLSELHPNNQHIKPKIRQQLQFLRNKRFIKFKQKGFYEILTHHSFSVY